MKASFCPHSTTLPTSLKSNFYCCCWLQSTAPIPIPMVFFLTSRSRRGISTPPEPLILHHLQVLAFFPRFAHSRCTSVNRTRIFIQITKKVMSYPPQLRRRERLQQSSSHALSESCCMHSLRTSLSLFMPFIHLHASTLHSPGLNNKANSILCSMRSLRATKRHRQESPLHLFSHTLAQVLLTCWKQSGP